MSGRPYTQADVDARGRLPVRGVVSVGEPYYAPPPDAITARWRTGRHVGRTIYAQPGPDPAGTDPLIGVMDTPALAAAAVDAHNALIRQEG